MPTGSRPRSEMTTDGGGFGSADLIGHPAVPPTGEAIGIKTREVVRGSASQHAQAPRYVEKPAPGPSHIPRDATRYAKCAEGGMPAIKER
jgi:hypothetical protein